MDPDDEGDPDDREGPIDPDDIDLDDIDLDDIDLDDEVDPNRVNDRAEPRRADSPGRREAAAYGGTEPPEPGPPGPDLASPDRDGRPETTGDLAQQALAAARSQPGRPRRRPRRTRERRMSGPGVDEYDPSPLGALVDRLVADRGWERPLADAGVFARWAELAGPEIAAHCRPERLTAGELVVAAESTAWATQLRLLAPMMLARLAERLGAGVVTGVQVQGPSQPAWVRGKRRVRGRGPRDDYG